MYFMVRGVYYFKNMVFLRDYVRVNFEVLEELRQSFSAGPWFRGWLYLGLIVGQTETDKFGSMLQSK
jgi:hypothetical protein